MQLSAIYGGAVGMLVINSLPAFAGILARYLGITAGDIGAFASADIAGITVGTLLGTPLMRRLSPRAAVRIGLAALLATSLGSCVTAAAAALVVLRALGGLGAGLAIAASFYVYALRDPERVSAAATIGQTASGFAAIAALPWLAARFGWQAAFACLSLLSFGALGLSYTYPGEPLARSSPSRAPRPAASAGLVLATLSVAVFYMGEGGLWTYLERIGAAAGFSEAQLATSLAICAAVGFLSSIAVLALGERVTRRDVLVASVAINLIAAALLQTRDLALYTLAISLYYLSLPFIATTQFGALARLPDGGRAAVLASTATFGGFALGPIAGGQIAEHVGYAAVRWLDIVLVSLAAALIWPLLARRTTAADSRAD